jgi:hypothetical protein
MVTLAAFETVASAAGMTAYGRFQSSTLTAIISKGNARNGKYPTVTGLLFSAYIINGLTTATDPTLKYRVLS